MTILTLAVLLSFGCGPGNPYDTVKVTGTVLVDGQPMQDVNVSFNPDGSDAPDAYGSTDAKGEFTLTIPGAPVGSGAVPGVYHPTFRKIVTEERPKAETPEEQAALEDKYPVKTTYVVPEKYGNRTTSGIDSVKVEKGQPNVFKFELSTK